MHYRVAIIGAGTAGLSARREVARVTDDYVVIDDGVLGTTCARVGCMPSKVLIQVANDFHRRGAFAEQGIEGADQLRVDQPAVMRHVRALRDRFVRAVRADMTSWEDHLLRKRARFIDLNTLELTEPGAPTTRITADRIVIATGSTPILPRAWEPFRHRLFDTDTLFERESLPARLAVVGLGVIGLELGQALSRLGVQVVGVTIDDAYGGLSDPVVRAYAHGVFSAELPVHVSPVERLEEEGDQLVLHLADGTRLEVDAALLTMGRRPQLASLGVSELVPTERGLPAFAQNTFRVEGAPWYIVGDANARRPLLHEAADEGRIAGYNAARDTDHCFQPRTSLTVTFSEPNIAMVGESHRQLEARGADFVTGSVSFEGQGRAIVKLAESGLLHVYAERGSGKLLGAELIAPDGEHLAHMLSWAISAGASARDVLAFPFYHPTIEEGLRTALRAAARLASDDDPSLEVLRCGDAMEALRADR